MPTVTTESVFIESAVRAKKESGSTIHDIQSALNQAEASRSGERVTMKNRGALVEVLLESCPKKYKDVVIGEF